MASTFRIHPALGIARVGDAGGPGFLGPELPGVPANWNFETGGFNDFKAGGRIKRQGVRFRVFEYAADGSIVGEVLPGRGAITSIEWTVHVANRKAAFFQFDGSSGEDGDFSQSPARNANVKGADRASFEIDTGPQKIAGSSVGPIPLPNPNPKTNEVIRDLGDMSTDDAGRLIFFGGRGKTLQLPGAPDIGDYVNNDGWFDDVSDGPVSAVVKFQDGSQADALGAWVSVGPPDFAPGIANVVSLYETIWDVVVRKPAIPIPDLAFFRRGGTLEPLNRQRDDWDDDKKRFKTYKPSFINDIASLLSRAFSAMFVHDPPDIKKAFHNILGPQEWSDLGDPDPLKDPLRATIFKRMRDPESTAAADSRQMPRGLGDEYCDETDPDSGPGSDARKNFKRFFSVTRTQYAMLAQWASRNFNPDGSSPAGVPSAPSPITPDGLDRAALENCVGGPFFPGIEVSWTIRNPVIYLEPFRFKPGVKIANGNPAIGIPDVIVRPGFLTQQMALPWQADFRDCKREPLTNTATGAEAWAMWWAGQRPDDVFPENDSTRQVAWTRPPHFNAGDDDNARYKEMVSSWSTLGFVAKKDSKDPRRWLETERSE